MMSPFNRQRAPDHDVRQGIFRGLGMAPNILISDLEFFDTTRKMLLKYIYMHISNYTGILEPKRQDSLFVGKPGGKDSKPSCFSKLGDRIISISKKDKIWLQPIPIVSSLLVEMGQQFSKRQGDNGGISD